MEDDYKPVSSAFLDELEDLCLQRRPCEVRFWQDGGKAVIHGRMDRVYESDGAAFVLMDSGLGIRLDRLIEVNGQPTARFC